MDRWRSAGAMLADLRQRRVSAVELLDAAVARIEAEDGALNAVVVRDFARARVAAAAADQALARGDRRPLLGLPMTVKESFDVAGLPTTWGWPGAHAPAHDDAVVVARLKAAGAVLLGKTNVAAGLADWQTVNPVYGLTHNPWSPAHTAGGSSGGSAAALAAGFVALEFGSDLAGSLRVPAHCCGVLAHKPTHALVPQRGHAPPGTPVLSVAAALDISVVGPMARDAADLALALQVTAGPDDADAVAYRLRLPPPRHAALRAHRVLVLDRHPLLPTADAVRAALDTLARNLERSGCRVGRQSALCPDLTQLATLWRRLVSAFVGAELPADEYANRLSEVVTADASPFDAAGRDGLVISHRAWVAADRERAQLAHAWRVFFREWDVLLCPAMPGPAGRHDTRTWEERTVEIDGQSVPYATQSLWSSVASATGLPATAVPIGIADGLPIGAQVIGPWLEDRTTIAFAGWLQRELGGFTPPPARLRAGGA